MTTSNRLINPAPPSLPLGTDTYERRYQDQFTNILRLYFNQLQNALTEILTQGPSPEGAAAVQGSSLSRQ